MWAWPYLFVLVDSFLLAPNAAAAASPCGGCGASGIRAKSLILIPGCDEGSLLALLASSSSLTTLAMVTTGAISTRLSLSELASAVLLVSVRRSRTTSGGLKGSRIDLRIRIYEYATLKPEI